MKIGMGILMGLLATASATELDLWNGDMPGKGAEQPEGLKPDNGDHVQRLTNVSNPTLTFYPAKDSGKPNAMVVVCPGGGYNILCMDKEGTEIAEWLNSIGISAGILKYRCPQNREGALQDAQQAIKLVRKKAGEWNLDPKRIGMLGFSAGGHLAAACSNSADRPDFTVLVYPAYLFKPGGIELVDEIKVDANTPPAFVVQTNDDRKYYRSTLAYGAALDAAGVPVEIHLFAKGGHGYGLRPTKHPVAKWPELCEAWMRASGFLD